jgi:RNA polymerase sigma-70 factor (ECF subfamily)
MVSAIGEAKMIGDIQSDTSASNTAPRSRISDLALVQSIAHGDKDALKLLYVRHRERVCRFVVRLTGMESIADDVVNEVFLSVWRRADEFEGKSQVATWLLGIARFKALSECRGRREAPLDQEVAANIEDPADNPALSTEKRERSDILQRCLAKLTPVHRDVLNLIYYQGQKVEEVARSTGAPVSTIKTRLHYARSRMAGLLAEAGVDRAWAAI